MREKRVGGSAASDRSAVFPAFRGKVDSGQGGQSNALQWLFWCDLAAGAAEREEE